MLGANRYGTMVDELRDLVEGAFGRTPGPIDPALVRAVELLRRRARGEPRSTSTTLREEAEGLAASEEELLLLALFGEEAEPLLRAIRERSGGDESLGAHGRRPGARRADPRGRADRPGDRHRRDHDRGGRHARERAPHRRADLHGRRRLRPQRPQASAELPPVAAARLTRSSGSRARWSARSTARPRPASPPFVEEGDAVAPGQTLCILEAMKLMNEVKAEVEAIVRAIHVDDAQPVEYGQLLFELEPINGRPLDAV